MFGYRPWHEWAILQSNCQIKEKKSKIVDKMRIIQHDEQLYIANFHEKE